MSSPFSLLLVVKIRKRWEVVGFVAMNLSMMRLQMPRPSPLFASQDSAKLLLELQTNLLAPVTRTTVCSESAIAPKGAPREIVHILENCWKSNST